MVSYTIFVIFVAVNKKHKNTMSDLVISGYKDKEEIDSPCISHVYNMDCLEFMKQLPDNYFDLAVSDPPYGGGNDEGAYNRFGELFNKYKPKKDDGKKEKAVNHSQGGIFAKYNDPAKKDVEDKLGRIEWDVAPKAEFFDELFRVSKNQVIWGGNYFPLPPTRCFLIWKKHVPENFSMAMCEYAWTSFAKNAKVFELPSTGIPYRFHPTQKPEALYAWVYKLLANKGDKLFDPMMGSQSSRVAAYKMGFDYYGCELCDDYFKQGVEKFDRECLGEVKAADGKVIKQMSLFD